MTPADAAVVEHTHRTQARAIAREPHIDTRPIFREPAAMNARDDGKSAPPVGERKK